MHLLEKTERRLGEKLFIKGERCLGPKCAIVRRKYPPGIHGKKRGGRKSSSGFGALLSEKQKVRFLYGLDDHDISRYSRDAEKKRGVFGDELLKLLEARLDNTLFRLGVLESRRFARQAVSHGHVLVNGKIARSPSYQTRPGDRISIKDRFAGSPAVASRIIQIKKHTPPAWLKLNVGDGRLEGIVLAPPSGDDLGVTIDVTKVKEFYSR